MDEPSIATPESLFKDSSRYYAPVFQREYVWGRKEWNALAGDITALEGEDQQFLGAIVLKSNNRIEGQQSPEQWLVIDGQQRLTTLYLVLVAVAAVAAKQGDPDTAESIWKTHLAETKKHKKYDGLPKFVPTLQDRATFYEILREALPSFESRWNFLRDPADSHSRPSKKLERQWRLIFEWVHKFAVPGGKYSTDRLEDLQSRILHRLQLIWIGLDESDNESDIFDRLNAKGVPLELADLVRNEIFGKFGASASSEAQKFFQGQWQPFQDQFPAGELSSFFPIFAFVKLQTKATKATAFGELQKLWSKRQPNEILKELREYSDFHRALCNYSPIPGIPKELNLVVDCLSRMPKTNVTWPFLFEVLHAVRQERLTPAKAEECLRVVESFLVRRALCGYEPTGLHTVFRSLWGKTKGCPKSLRKHIVTRTIECPSDKDIRDELSESAVDTRRIRWFIFQEWERDVAKQMKGDGSLTPPVTIEHVLPKNLTREWVKYVCAEDHRKYVGLIGNLAPLSEKQNKSLRDSPWQEKQRRYKSSAFLATQQLATFKRWNSKAIQTRTKEMTEWVLRRWPAVSV